MDASKELSPPDAAVDIDAGDDAGSDAAIDDAETKEHDAGPPDANCGDGDDASDAGDADVPIAAHWAFAASMAQARTQHTATLLDDGRVLVVGGLGTSAAGLRDLATAELYDPCTESWSPAGTLGQARNGHSAVLLHDGRILVVGGSYQGFATDTAELYEPATRTWSPATAPPTTLYGPALLLESGEILLAGGKTSDISSALYDPATGLWSPTAGDAASTRYGHAATLLDNGRVLMTGGFSWEPYTPALLECEVFDPVARTWSPGGTLSRMRNGHGPVLLRSGRVLISGGYPQAPDPTPPSSTEIYDPTTNNWSAGMDLRVARWLHSTTLLPDGRVLIVGGSSSSGAGSALTSAELYDEDTGTFSSTASLNAARWSHTATLLRDGRVLVVGGLDGTNPLTSVELYRPEVR